MGVDLRPLLLRHEIVLENLSGKVLAIDAFNQLYMYLAVIRQPDGTPLTDSKGNITSHLSGLFYRTLNLLEAGIMPFFVFDGKAPEEKFAIQKERAELREEAQKKYEKALSEEKLEEARKYAQQAAFLTKEMVIECKELISAMGLPWVQAPAEGEAQAAQMALRGDAWAVVSQDYDCLLFGGPRLIRNLTISGKRKFNSKIIEVKPELIDLAECLNYLGMDIEKLIEIALLIGTDYNPGGVQGIGPKTALKIVRENKFLDYLPNADRLKNLFLKPLVSLDYSLEWKKIDKEKLREILIEKHDFSSDRVEAAIKRLDDLEKAKKQVGLDSFF